MKSNVIALAVAALLGSAPAFADTHGAAPETSAQQATMVGAEVRKVDKEQGKITLRHEPIPNLEMPTMTMVFRVQDPTLLDQVKAGDKVKFAADRVNGQYTVIALELAR